MAQPLQNIGRMSERKLLQEIFANARNGHSKMVLISGESGMGKTLLAEEALAASQFLRLTGRSNEEIDPPYAPIAQAIRYYFRQHRDDSFADQQHREYLSLLLPELGSPPESPDRERLVEAICQTFAYFAGQQPLAIFLDDLQWADDATLDLLPDISERLQHSQIVFLGTYRSDELPRGHRLRWVRNELRRRHHLEEIHLDPLSQKDSTALMALQLDSEIHPQLAKTIFDQTEGVPLFIVELAIALESSGALRKTANGLALRNGYHIPLPESIRDAILIRLDGLSQPARDLLECAAMYGMSFSIDMLIELAGDETGLDELFDRQLFIETQQGEGMFRHALTREAVKSEMLWSQKRSINRNIASFLEKADASPEMIAEHWLAGNQLEKARDAFMKAAKRSCQIHAYRDAARAGSRALEIWNEGENESERLEALVQLAHCAHVSGQLSQAIRVLRELSASEKIRQTPKKYAEIQRSLATVYGLQGARDQAISARTIAAEIFENAGMDAEAATEWLATAALWSATLNEKMSIDLLDRSISLSRKTDRPDIQARAMALKGNLLSAFGNSREGIEMVNDALALALANRMNAVAYEVYRRLGSTLEYASAYVESRETFLSAYNYCRTQGDDEQAELCLSCMSYVLFRTGDWKQSIDVCQNVIKNIDSPISSLAITLGTLGLMRGYRGEMRQARKYLQDSLAMSGKNNLQPMVIISHWGLAEISEFENDDEAAKLHYLNLIELREKLNDKHDSLPGILSAARFFAQRNQEKELTLCANAATEIASETGNPEALGILAYVLGEMALLNDEWQDAIQQFKQAFEQVEKLAVPVEILKCEYRLGQAYLANRDRENGVRHLHNAYRTARNLGARSLSGIIAAILEDAGEPVEEPRNADAATRQNRSGLTRRQLEIARLIAEGLTNKEIADRLFVSPRTVDMHVSHLLDRLDCRTRSEAVRKVSEMGMLD